jgi:hypothetical protein
MVEQMESSRVVLLGRMLERNLDFLKVDKKERLSD